MLPRDRALVERFENEPFTLLGVDCNDGDASHCSVHFTAQGVTWRNAIDDERSPSLSGRWNVRTVPRLYLLDAQGVIRQRCLGAPKNGVPEQAIDELVAEARPRAESPPRGSLTRTHARATRPAEPVDGIPTRDTRLLGLGAQKPWYDTAFEAGYLELYPYRDLAAARAEVAGLVARGVGAGGGRVLDLGCGFGRHLQALRERGLDALGLDRSRELLACADASLRGRLVRGDFRALPFHGQAFASVLMLFSSFGYFEDGENARTLAEVARVLAPGGLAVLDLMNPACVRATLVPESRTQRGSLEILERRRLECGGERVVKDVCVRAADGRERRWCEDVRLYEARELEPLLASAGLALLRSEGDFDGRLFEPGSARQIVWARRDVCGASA
jgi:SAM-dependent methyltransferase